MSSSVQILVAQDFCWNTILKWSIGNYSTWTLWRKHCQSHEHFHSFIIKFARSIVWLTIACDNIYWIWCITEKQTINTLDEGQSPFVKVTSWQSEIYINTKQWTLRKRLTFWFNVSTNLQSSSGNSWLQVSRNVESKC